MAKRPKRPSWFKLWLHHKSLIEAVPDDVAGRAIKAALYYFSTGETPQLGQLEAVVFASMRSDIDESISDYARDVENGRKGGRPKIKDEEKPPVTEGNPSLPPLTEGEGEGEGEGEKKEKVDRADKPPTRHRFSPPSVEEVKAYCQEKGYNIDPEQFVDFYESKGWMIGKTKMKSWQAAVRTWAKRDDNTPATAETFPDGCPWTVV